MLRASGLSPCSPARYGLGSTRAAVLSRALPRPRAPTAILDSCAAVDARVDAAWLDAEETSHRKLLPDKSFYRDLEGELKYANLDNMVAEENWEAVANMARGLSTLFGSKVCLTVDGLDLDLRAPFTPAINGTTSNR